MARKGKTLSEVEVLSRKHSRRAVATLVGIMNQPKASDRARIKAAIAILDFGWGKPKRGSIWEKDTEFQGGNIRVEYVSGSE